MKYGILIAATVIGGMSSTATAGELLDGYMATAGCSVTSAEEVKAGGWEEAYSGFIATCDDGSRIAADTFYLSGSADGRGIDTLAKGVSVDTGEEAITMREVSVIGMADDTMEKVSVSDVEVKSPLQSVILKIGSLDMSGVRAITDEFGGDTADFDTLVVQNTSIYGDVEGEMVTIQRIAVDTDVSGGKRTDNASINGIKIAVKHEDVVGTPFAFLARTGIDISGALRSEVSPTQGGSRVSLTAAVEERVLGKLSVWLIGESAQPLDLEDPVSAYTGASEANLVAAAVQYDERSLVGIALEDMAKQEGITREELVAGLVTQLKSGAVTGIPQLDAALAEFLASPGSLILKATPKQGVGPLPMSEAGMLLFGAPTVAFTQLLDLQAKVTPKR